MSFCVSLWLRYDWFIHIRPDNVVCACGGLRVMEKNTESSVFLTHWGRVTHICVGNLTIIGTDNGLSPRRRQAIIWTNAGILSIGHLGTNFNEKLIEIQIFSFKKMRLKMSSAKWRLFSLGLNELNIFFGDASLTPRQSCDCPNDNKITLKDIGERNL